VINPDAHRKERLQDFVVWNRHRRKGWLTKDDVGQLLADWEN